MSAYSSLILGKSPAAYWRLSEASSTFFDATGNGHNATAVGTITRSQTGLITNDSDTCVLFDGSTGCVSSGVSGVDISTGDWTMEAWIYPTAITTRRGIIGTPGVRSYAFCIESTGKLLVTNVNIADASLGTTTVPLSTVSHVAVTFVDSSDTLTYYYNGQPDGSFAFTTTPDAGAKTGVVGSRNLSAQFFQGNIDEPAIYTTALSAASIAQNYTVGLGRVSFSNTVLPTVTGNLNVGATLTANPGTWLPTPSSFNYFWHREDDALGTNLVEIGATGSTYTLSSSDLNKFIRAGVIPVQ